MIDVGGIVICGGQSLRMGRPKAWLSFGPEFLLQRVVRRLVSATSPNVVVAAHGQALPELPEDIAIVRDERPGVGPLEGIRVGLRQLEVQAGFAFLCGCDAPFIAPECVRLLVNETEGSDVVLVHDDEREYPLFALYKSRLHTLVDELVAAGLRRPKDLFDRVATRRVHTEQFVDFDPNWRSGFNVNTPDDYQEALRLAGFAISHSSLDLIRSSSPAERRATQND